MFATEESVNSTGSALSENSVSAFRSGGHFVFKSDSNSNNGSNSIVGPFHQLHSVIITPVASPATSPSAAPSPQPSSPLSIDTLAALSSAGSSVHLDMGKFSPSLELTSPSSGLSIVRSSLPPPPPLPMMSMGRSITPRTDPTGCEENGIRLLGGKYILLDQLEGSNLRRCIDVQTQEPYVCKVVNHDGAGRGMLAAHYRVDGHPNINPIHEVVLGDRHTYLFFPPCFTDLHSYVRTRRRLREPQARPLFRQIVSAVHEAHSKGIVLRDLKLRKFVFADESRTELKLESLEDAIVLDDASHDLLSDKHGCPAYVSPEILTSHSQYSGRAADMWGLGVMLYTMLVGRYPFHGQEHTGLFAKIRRGHFSLPDSLSSRAKCLIRCLLRKEPDERLNTEDVLIHPWMTQQSNRERYRRSVSSATVATASTVLPSAMSSTSSGGPALTSWLHSNGNNSSVASSSLSLSQMSSASSSLTSTGLTGSENIDQLVPDCVMADYLDVDRG